MQPPYDKLPGIISTAVGYTGGSVKNPSYEQVTSGKTGHLEAVQIVYDKSKLSYSRLLDIFWQSIDPTQAAGQFVDIGSQYKTAVFYHSEEQKRLAEQSKEALEKSGRFDRPIVTPVVPAQEFYPAEDYHQKYYQKNFERYQMYKTGSGRERFLKKVWADLETEKKPAK